MDAQNDDERSVDKLRAFLLEQQRRGISSALVIGGEPTLFPRRLEAFVEHMPFVSISTNGLVKLPYEGFERVGIGLSVFGGGPLDDQLRAIRPNGKRFEGLFETSLRNYRNDPRVVVNYAVAERGIEYIEETVQKVADNGNLLLFSYYSSYDQSVPQRPADSERLIDELLRVRQRYPQTVTSHPYYIQALIRGRTEWGTFGYDSCASTSVDHPDNAARLRNGNPYLLLFNAYGSDLSTVNKCCTSGRCDECRDSQAVISWLMVNMKEFTRSPNDFQTWVELCESYWSAAVWSPFYRKAAART
jgi:hypothetical protein